jgi:hypothetical protein
MLGGEQTCDRVDTCDLESLLASERRKHSWEPTGEHRLPGAGRPDEQEVVGAGCCNLERTTGPFLAPDLRQVRSRAACESLLRQWVERRRLDLSAEVGNGLGECPDRHGLDACKRGFWSRLRRAHDPAESGSASTLGDGERARDRPDAPVEGELPDRGMFGESLGRELARGREHGEGDGEIEARSLLAQRGGCEVDRDPSIEGPLERSGHDTAPYPVLCLLAGPICKPDDREPRNAGLQVRLDLHAPGLEADERVGDCPSEHARHGRHWSAPEGHAPVPIELRNRYGV